MKIIKYFDEVKGEVIELMVTNEAIEKLKEREGGYEKDESKDDLYGNLSDVIIYEKSPLESQISKKLKKINLIKKGFKILTEKERVLVKKVFYENYTQAELARELGVARSTIKNRYDSVLYKLQNFILDNESEGEM